MKTQANQLQGVDEFVKALKKYDQDLLKTVQTEIKGIAKQMVTEAKGYVPGSAPRGLSNWEEQSPRSDWYRLRFDSSRMKAGIYLSFGRRRSSYGGFLRAGSLNKGWFSQVSLLNTTGAGAVYELAGRRNPDGRPPAPRYTGRIKSFRQAINLKKFNNSRNPNAGKQFVEAIEFESGIVVRNQQGRLILRAFENHKREVVPAVHKAILNAKDIFYSRCQTAPRLSVLQGANNAPAAPIPLPKAA